MSKYDVVSLFAGCGGLDLGFKGGFSFLKKSYTRNKFRLTWANDIDENACKTYTHNFRSPIICCDINNIISKNRLPEKADVVLGGFPCQDFSHAGKRLGFDAERGNLYKAMGKVITKLEPKLFVAENVKGLLTIPGAIETIKRDFSRLGYHVSHQLYNTADFGVPQRRERVLIVGTRKDILPAFIFPSPPLDKAHWMPLREAIGDLEKVAEGQIDTHYWSKAKRNKGQGNGTVDPDRPGPTMRAEHHGNIEFHWNDKRRLSAREAARIQSFPDEFEFLPSTSAAYKQVGNAVAPVFAWHFARHLQKFLDKHLDQNGL